MYELVPPLPGAHTKNLFLRDKKGRRHFPVVVGYDKNVSLKESAAVAGAQGVSFASPERLKERFGVEPGSVTLLALAHDPSHAVEVFIDEDLWKADGMLARPLVNTSALSIPLDGIEEFLAATGRAYKVIAVPGI